MIDNRRRAVAGAAAALASLGVGELVAGAIASLPSLVSAVGTVVIDNVPTPIKEWAIATFGTADKAVLVAGIVVVVALVGAGTGVASGRRPWLAPLVFGAFGLAGALAAVVTGSTPAAALVVAGVAAGVGLLALRRLFALGESGGEQVPDGGRRSFLLGAGAVVAVAALSAGVGQFLADRGRRLLAGRDSVVLPVPVGAAPPPPPGAALAVEGLSELVTPNDRFYKIDTALSVPRVDLEEWTVAVTGMVDRPLRITYDELLAMDMVERYITLTCVSNEVGGSLIGNAKWLGVPLSVLLDRAGVSASASQVVGRSVEGFTVGFPTSVAYDGREALVAVGMNDEPLPFDHGFPARLVVAGLYGYVSATKWLAEIELTTWDGYDAYWVPRGWAKEGPIKTQSRIDTPRNGVALSTEPRAIAGVAWAPNRGISRVEVEVDGDWHEAELAESLDDDAWRQWQLSWTPSAGAHTIRVRATDRTGETQTPDRAPPAPDGATGWHTIEVTAGG